MKNNHVFITTTFLIFILATDCPAGNYGFTGQARVQEAGIYYNRARYLDPETGRFLSKDPIGVADSLNTYSYVDANPVNETERKRCHDANC